ncbi:MAG: phosphoribosylformylglycinamidine synthase subunit PurQ [Phycisphaerales bacterium]|nr:phosphoribosylformylglycinamidine synthase subunit PurQ [Phycisphaerales bacterium]
MSKPTALVIRTAGTNCDLELCRGFELAGAQVELIHLDRLIADPAQVARFDLVGFPGGFSYGDDIASGRILAMHTRDRLLPELLKLADRGVPMIGVCNGFQVMVQIGLLPGRVQHEQSTALCENDHGRFIDQWVEMVPDQDSNCIWTQGLLENQSSEPILYPVAHGEGRFVTKDQATLDALNAGNQVAIRYGTDINGSVDQIAGICDPSGRIFGLMPHPERALDWNRHPFWTRLDEKTKKSTTPGLSIFLSAVDAVARQSV